MFMLIFRVWKAYLQRGRVHPGKVMGPTLRQTTIYIHTSETNLKSSINLHPVAMHKETVVPWENPCMRWEEMQTT